MNLMETLKHRQTKNHFATAAGVKRSTIAAVLLVLYLPATLQKCHDEKYAQDNCGVRYDYDYGYNRHSCTEYFEMHCYEVTNMLESSHMESVHRIVVNSGDLKFLSSALFDGFNNVESITMIGSSITNIKPNTFFNLSQLQSVNLTNNMVEVLSGRSFNSISLKTVDLSNNNISTIEYSSFNNVMNLILHHNRIMDVSNLVASWTSLTAVDLSYNDIKTIELSEKCSNLLSLKAIHNNLNKFTVNSGKLLKVRSLDLSWNNLSDISSRNLLNINELDDLNLSNNPLFNVNSPSINLFQNTLALQLLNLSSTGIQEIYVGTFSKLSNLKILDISHNNLTTLSKGIFYDLKNLEQLYLNDNRLKYFYPDRLTKIATVSLNANLLTCDTLVDIIDTLSQKNAHIVSGDTREEKNIFGIQCLDSLEDVNSMVDQFNNMTEHKNSKGNEYSESLHKVEQIIQQLSLEQENRSFLIVNQLNKSDTYWRNLTQDYKGLFQTMQQSIKDTLYKITSAFTSSMNTNTIRINELRENGSLEQWKLLQRNFTEALNIDRYNFLDALLSKLQHNFKEINQNIKDVNTPRNTSLKMDLDFSRTSSFRNADEKLSSEEKNRNVLTVGVYGILLVLVVGLVLSLLSKLRSCRSVKNNLEECNPLNSISV